jgi:PPOX class probable F420-dependent enzyme
VAVATATAVFHQNGAMTNFPDSHHDLLEGQFASLATIDGKGFPQVTVLWFIHHDGELHISLNASRLKARHLQRRPQCSLLLLDLSNPFRYLEVRGNARIEPDEGGTLAKLVGEKYSADLAQFDQPGDTRLAVTIEPTNVYAVDLSG